MRRYNFEKGIDWGKVRFVASIIMIILAIAFSIKGCTPEPLPTEKVICLDGYYLNDGNCEKVRF